MKGDFSRLTREFASRWSGVLMQQGRPLLDADWNEAMALQRQALSRVLSDLIGKAGGPADRLGFAITPVCSLRLNESGAADKQYIHIQDLPTDAREAAKHDADECEDAYHWEDDGGHPDGRRRPHGHTVQLGLTATAASAGPLLCWRGLYTLALEADGSLFVEHAEKSGKTSVGKVPPGTPCDVLVARTVHGLKVKIGGGDTVEVKRHHELGHGGEIFVAAESAHDRSHREVDGFVTCGISALRVWSAPLNPDRLAPHLAQGRLPRRGLVCDLDTGRIVDRERHHGTLHDRSGHRCHARLHWHAKPPRIDVNLSIGPGQYFVDGMACSNAGAVLGDAQSFLPDAAAAAVKEEGTYLVYLDVWDRAVDALEGPDMADPALLGTDTTVRVETVWQVRAERWESKDHSVHELRRRKPRSSGALTLERSATPTSGVGNGLLRVEIHHPGWTCPRLPLSGDSAAKLIAADLVKDPHGWAVALPPDAPRLEVGSPLLVCTRPDGGDGDCRLTEVVQVVGPDRLRVGALPDGAALGRVWLLPVASFKWSRDNASVAFPVAELRPDTADDGSPVGLAMLSSRGFNGFEIAVGDWLELTDRAGELMGRPGRFYRVKGHQEELLQITLADWIPQEPPVPIGRDCVLRLWSQPAGETISRGDDGTARAWPQPVTAASVALDPGVRIGFEAGAYYHSGDYWTAPIREDASTVAGWPLAGGQPAPQPPHGVIHHLAPLALLHVGDHKIEIEDLREAFPTVVALGKRESPDKELPEAAVELIDQLIRWLVAEGLMSPDGSMSRAQIAALRQICLALLFDDELLLLSRSERPPIGFKSHHARVVARCLQGSAWQTMDWKTPAAPARGAHQGVLAGTSLVFVGRETSLAYSVPFAEWRHIPHLSARDHEAVAGYGDSVVLAGGHERYTDIDVFNLATSERKRVGSMRFPTRQAAAVVVGDMLYIVGGVDRDGRITQWAQFFDLKKNEPHGHHEFPVPLAEAAAVVWGGQVFVMGGYDRGDKVPTNTVWRFDPAHGFAAIGKPLPKARRLAAAAVVPEGIVVAGGVGASGELLADVDLYDPRTDQWLALAPLPFRCHSPGLLAEPENLAPIDARLLAAGGVGDDGPLTCNIHLPLLKAMHVLSRGVLK